MGIFAALREGLLKMRSSLILLAVVASLAAASAPSSFTVKFNLAYHHPGAPSGPAVVELAINRTLAPKGVDHFYELLSLSPDSYYAQNGFFRVVSNFVVQFGINGSP